MFGFRTRHAALPAPPPPPVVDPAAREHALRVLSAVRAAADPRGATLTALRALGHSPAGGVLAMGKAARAMLRACDEALGRRCHALAVAPPSPDEDDDPRVLIADHPLPTERSVDAGRAVESFVREAAGHDRPLTVLISGGSSALVTLPIEPVTLDDLRVITRVIMAAGLPIRRLNTVRRHMEQLKGGGLALRSGGAPVVGLVLSDVVDGGLEDVASGPLSPDPSTRHDAELVLEAADVEEHDPGAYARAMRVLRDEHAETPKPGDPRLAHARVHVIGDHQIARRAAVRELRRLGYAPVFEVPGAVTGEARDAGKALVQAAVGDMGANPAPFAIVASGETTVTLGDHSGFGGRNQELALAAALELDRLRPPRSVTVMSFGTDGVDGVFPPDEEPVAGAIMDASTAGVARAHGLLPGRALLGHDAYTLLAALDERARGQAAIRVGPTGTNVNDVMVALVR